jgi:hypothetical protein
LTSKEKAEFLFKQERLSGGPSSIAEYEQRARGAHKDRQASRVTARARSRVGPQAGRNGRRDGEIGILDPQLSRIWNRPLRSVRL